MRVLGVVENLTALLQGARAGDAKAPNSQSIMHPGKFRRKALELTTTPFFDQQATTSFPSNHNRHIYIHQNAALTIRSHPFHLQRTT
jgi:hypothetical protein